jgi:hypothetical protein
VNLAKTLENKRFKVVAQHQNMLDIHVSPFEMCVRGVQVTHCQDAHGHAKKKACYRNLGYVM